MGEGRGMRLRLTALAATLAFVAGLLVAVPLAAPAGAHGGACDAYAQKPKLVRPGEMEVFGSFWCPSAHQKVVLTVQIQARAKGATTWKHYHEETVSKSGVTTIALGYRYAHHCNIDFRTVVKGLAGSSGTTTHSKTVRSAALKTRCA
jgi:hypothetical protein